MGLSMQIATPVNLKSGWAFFLTRQCQRVGLTVCFACKTIVLLFYLGWKARQLLQRRSNVKRHSMRKYDVWREKVFSNKLTHTQRPRQYKQVFFSALKCLKYNDQYLKEHLFLPQQLYCVIWRATLYLTSWWLDCWKKL